MRQRLRSSLTYANVMATIAVFLVLGGGTALGAFVVSNNGQIGPNTVSGHKPFPGEHANIIPGTLNDTDLAASAITGPKIAANAVNSSKVTDNSLTGGDVASLTGADVTDNSLTGADVNEASLDVVPNADKLDGLDSSALAPQPAAFTAVDMPQFDPNNFCQPGLDGWQQTDPAGLQAAYYRDPAGIVFLEGSIVSCGAAQGVIFTLPAGYRPGSESFFAAADVVGGGVPALRGLRLLGDGRLVYPSSNPGSGHVVYLDGISFRCVPSGQDGCP